MNGGFPGLRGKQFPFILISLVCISIFAWTWEKTPLPSALRPPQTWYLHLSSDLVHYSSVGSMSAKPHTYVDTNTTLTGKGTINKRTEQSFDAVVPEGVARISPQPNITNSSLSTTDADKGNAVSVQQDVARDQQIPKEDHPKQSKSNEDVVAPVCSTNTSPVLMGKDDKNASLISHGQGKWVIDSTRPLYSGFGCKQWLSEMWACRLTKRMDFAYEKLRWQPKGCRMDEFRGSKFLERLLDKTLAFIGDSLGRQQFQSLMCILTGGEQRSHVTDIGKEYGLVKAHGAKRPDGWAFHFSVTNTTILYYWSASLCDLQPVDVKNPATDYAMHLDRPPAFLQRFIHRFDVLILNTGHHWNRGKLNANRWLMHVGGNPYTNRRMDIRGAKNFTIYSIIKWVSLQLPKYPSMKAFYRTISPRHFFNGDWNTGGRCENTTPMSIGKEILREASRDHFAAGAVQGTMVNLLDITALSQLRDEGHISRYSIRATPGVRDCLHWCLPGIPDTWNEILFAQLGSNGVVRTG